MILYYVHLKLERFLEALESQIGDPKDAALQRWRENHSGRHC